jgi:hypothetical protein
MWITRQAVRPVSGNSGAGRGAVTVSGDTLAVFSGGERRDASLCTAGGILWRPRLEEEVVLLSLDGEQSRPCVLGVLASPDTDLEPGELRLQSDGASLTLRNNGDIELVGQLKTTSSTDAGGDA